MKSIIDNYDIIVIKAEEIFTKECFAQGTDAWRILRPKSILDRIFEIASEVKFNIENSNKLNNRELEAKLISLLNTSIIARVQLTRGLTTTAPIVPERAIVLYKQSANLARKQVKMLIRSLDSMNQVSLTSFMEAIIERTKEMKELLDKGITGVHYSIRKLMDIINFSIFALILE